MTRVVGSGLLLGMRQPTRSNTLLLLAVVQAVAVAVALVAFVTAL